MIAADFAGYVGPPTGYVLQFSNGLLADFSRDTGTPAKRGKVVRGFYKSGLAVINIGDTFMNGPVEAACVVNELVKSKSVIPSHANEAATSRGNVTDGMKTATSRNLAAMTQILPLSLLLFLFCKTGAWFLPCRTYMFYQANRL